MATGIGKNKLKETEYSVTHTEPFPLPSASDPVELSYPCKISAQAILAPLRTEFKPIYGKSKSVKDNSFVLGDNYLALHELLNQGYKEKVDLIYLDPPFCTGFDFYSRQMHLAYRDQLAPSSYLEFMRRRLILLHELLGPTGSLYLHIGHQMLFHLKVLMDEIFGSANFRNLIVRRKCSSKNYTSKQLPNIHDYVLFYTKSPNYKWNQPRVKASDEWIKREYSKRDSKGLFKLVPIHAPGTRNGKTGQPWRGKLPPPGKHWQFTPERLEELEKSGGIHWSKNENPRRKVYLPHSKELPLTDYWQDFRDAHHQSIRITGYPTEKNLDLLKVIIRASTNEGDLVLDPFCGSGTTVCAAEALNRKWIGIDQSVRAIETSIRRMKQGSLPMGDYVKHRDKSGSNELFETSDSFRGKSNMTMFNVFSEGQLAETFRDALNT